MTVRRWPLIFVALFAVVTARASSLVACTSFDEEPQGPGPTSSLDASGDQLTTSSDGPNATDPDASVPPEFQADPKNCGRVGHSCLDGACSLGKCQPFPIALNQQNVRSIALDANAAYWTLEQMDGSVVRFEYGGMAAKKVVTGLVNPQAVLVLNDRLYWTTKGSALLEHCSPTNCATFRGSLASTLSAGGHIATDGTSIFVTDGAGGQKIATCPATGSVCIAQSNTSGAPPLRVAFNGGGLYFASSREIRRWVPGGNISDVFEGKERLEGLADLAVAPDGNTVFFVNRDSGRVGRADVKLPSSQTTQIVLFLAARPERLALDGEWLVWSDFGKNGSPPQLVACKHADCAQTVTSIPTGLRPFAIAVDAASVWYSELGAEADNIGPVMRIAKWY